MQKNFPKIYCFVNEFNLTDLSKLSKNINIIYRNYEKIDHLKNILRLKKFCKKSGNKFFLSNNIKLSIKLGLSGVYIPSFNKKINYAQIHKFPKSFDILGSAHNLKEVLIKKKQHCNEIFLSPVFKVNKSNKFLGITKFNLITLNVRTDYIALGGINERNFKKVKLLRSKGIASISWAKKNGLEI